MKQFFRDMWATLWLLFWLIIGIFVSVQLLRWLNGEQWQQLVTSGSLQSVEQVQSLDTAVQVISALFIGTFGLRFFDRFLFRGGVINRLGFRPGAPTLLGLLTFSFVHGNDNHLFGNIKFLLLFAGIMALLVPSLQAFIIATIVILILALIGFLLFAGKKTNQVGASSVLLGYYSFNVLYGLFALGIGGSITAVLLVLIFGRPMWRTLRASGGNISQVGHVSGFIGGIFAATTLVRLGMF